MEALKNALAELKAADARYHDLIDPEAHMAKTTLALAVATAETVLASVTALSERIAKLEAPAAPIPPAPAQPEEAAAAEPAAPEGEAPPAPPQ